jgi:uncharacterized protein (DUF2267 family)
VIQYAPFIEAVGAQTGAADTEEARRATEAVIAAVAASLEEPDRDRLARSCRAPSGAQLRSGDRLSTPTAALPWSPQ